MSTWLRTAALPLLRLHWRLLLLLLLGVLLPLLLVADLVEDIFRDGGFAWDQALLEWYAAHRTPRLTHAAEALAGVGGIPALPVITLLMALLLARYRTRAHAWFLLLSVSGATLLNGLAKLAFQRPRPEELVAVMVEPGFSFPSGHTMSNTAVGIALALIFWNSRARWPALVLGVVWALLMGISRNYLGVHFPTDVLVGWLSSVIWVTGLYALVRQRWTVLAAPALEEERVAGDEPGADAPSTRSLS